MQIAHEGHGPERGPVGLGFTLTEGGGARLTDLGNGEPLRPDQVPESLLAIEPLREGYDFLAQVGGRIRASVLVSDQTSPRSFTEAGIDLREELRHLDFTNGFLFLGMRWPAEPGDAYPKIVNLVSRGMIDAEVGVEAFPNGPEQELFPALWNTNTRTVMPGALMADHEEALTPLITTVEKLHAELAYLKLHRDLPYAHTVDARILSIQTTIENYLEWAMVGIIGCALKNHESVLHYDADTPILGTPLYTTIWLNLTQRDVARKISALTGQETEVFGPHPEQLTPRGQVLAVIRRAMAQAALSPEALAQYRALRAAGWDV
jgi:hypothetical protein